MNKEEVIINNYSISVLESLFRSKKDAGYQEIRDASEFLYERVRKERIYPSKVVEGFRSAMSIIQELTMDQFWLLKHVIPSAVEGSLPIH